MADFFDEVLKARPPSEVPPPPTSLFDEIQAERAARKPQGPRAISNPPIDPVRREQALAQQVGTQSLGEPGLGSGELNLETRRDLGLRSDISLSTTFEEKRAKFMSRFPDGDFVGVKDPRGGGETILFRKNEQEEFSELDPLVIDKFELLGDFADFAGEIPSLTGEMLTAFITRGSGFVRQALSIAAGNIIGEQAKEGVEALRGFQNETFSQVAKRSAVQGGFALGGALTATLLTGPLNFARKGFAPTPAGAAAATAAEALELPPMTAFQIAQSPLLQRLGGQSAATVSTIGQYVRRQQEASVQALTRLTDPDVERFAAGELAKLQSEAEKQIIASAKALPSPISKGGEALQAGFAELDNFESLIVNSAYARARKIEEPSFDLTAGKDVASQVKSITDEIDPAKGSAVSKLAQDIIDFNGQPKSFDLAGTGTQEVVSATDQIRALRQRARDLGIPPSGEVAKVEHLQSRKLEGALTRTLKNPQSDNPEFLSAWQEANDLAKSRFKTFDKLAVIEAAKSERPTQLVKRLARPNMVDDIVNIREAVPEARFNQFREAVKADFVAPENANTLTQRLESFDQPTLDALLTRRDQTILRDLGRNLDSLNSAGVKDALRRQSEFGSLIDELTNRGDTAGIKRLAELAPEGSLGRRSIRAGMMENLWNKVVTRGDQGQLLIKPKVLDAELSKLSDSGAAKFLTSEDAKVLNKLDQIAPFLPERIDSGTSLQAGEAAAGVRSLSASAIGTIIENLSLGRVLTTEGFNRFLARISQADLSFQGDVVRMAGAITADAVTEFRREQNVVQSGRKGTGLVETQDFSFPIGGS